MPGPSLCAAAARAFFMAGLSLSGEEEASIDFIDSSMIDSRDRLRCEV